MVHLLAVLHLRMTMIIGSHIQLVALPAERCKRITSNLRLESEAVSTETVSVVVQPSGEMHPPLEVEMTSI